MAFFNRNNSNDLPAGYDDTTSDFHVPAPLREEYQAADPAPETLMTTYLNRAVEYRAQSAEQAEQEEYARTHNGRTFIAHTGRETTADAVRSQGIQPGDDVLAEHLARLDYARSIAAARDAARREAAERYARRCRRCDAEDVPVSPVAVMAHPPVHSDVKLLSRSETVKLSADLTCADCAQVMHDQYRAAKATETTGDGRTRAERVTEHLRSAGLIR